MRGLAIIVALALVALAVYCIVRAIQAQRAKTKLETAEWEIHLEESADSSEFWLVKGETADFIGRALRNDDDYNLKFADLEAEAEEKILERNAAVRVLQRRNK